MENTWALQSDGPGSSLILSAYWLCDFGQVTSPPLCLNILIWKRGYLHPTLYDSWGTERTGTCVKCLAHSMGLADAFPSFASVLKGLACMQRALPDMAEGK